MIAPVPANNGITHQSPKIPSTPRLRIIFAGTPDFAAQHLLSLVASQHQIIAVYTQPDRPAGRGKKLQASPVKQVAEVAGLPIFQPASLKTVTTQAEIKELNADLMIVVAYGLLLPQVILDAPRFGCLNVHASLLPRWRGAAPIQRAIEAGDRETGITIMQMDAGLDTGTMLTKVLCKINDDDTAASLEKKLALLGPPALSETLELLSTNQLTPVQQDDAQATYAHKLSKEEGSIQWSKGSQDILRKIRAFNPAPICYSSLNREYVRIHAAHLSAEVKGHAGKIVSHKDGFVHIATGDGVIAVSQLQLPGKKVMAASDLLNGMANKLALGAQFE